MSDPIDSTILRAARANARPDALTDAGKDYLKVVLDPYHDYNVRGTGVPTLNAGSTYLRNIRLRESLVVPALPPGVAAWELHVFTTPAFCAQAAAELNSFMSGTGTVADPYRVKNTVSAVNPVNQLSHVCYAWVPVASPLGLLDPASVWQALPIGSPEWGSYRVVSSGFEVHNTTPELYRSGSVTTWKANCVSELSSVRLADTNGFCVSRAYNGIPATLSLANQFPTSRTWEAAQGCYVVTSPDFNDIGFKSYDEASIVIQTGAATSGTRHALIVGGFVDLDVGPEPGRISYRSGTVPSGAIFSSIAPESTFTIDCRVLVEVSPDLTAADLSIASQPTSADPVAMELAALAMANLPSGVPASMNASGDWFKMVLRTIGSVAPIVAGLVPHAGAQTAIRAAGMVAGAGASALDARQRFERHPERVAAPAPQEQAVVRQPTAQRRRASAPTRRAPPARRPR